MRHKHLLAVGLASAALLSNPAHANKNKHTVEYLDEVTPPGTIEPAQPATPGEPYRPYGTDAPATASTTIDAAVLEAFRAAYGKAGKPKLAIFVNRDFSDDVRDWGSDVRLKEGFVESRVTDQGRVTGAGTAITTVETRNDGDRRPREEQWIWRLDESILNPLLGVGAHVIDRAMAMRLTAVNATPDALGEVSVKNIETNALKGHADILVEVLVSNSRSAQFGYVFTIKATSIKDGRIMVRASSASWPPAKGFQTQGELIMDKEGNLIDADLPNPTLMGTWLVEDLLRGLTNSL